MTVKDPVGHKFLPFGTKNFHRIFSAEIHLPFRLKLESGFMKRKPVTKFAINFTVPDSFYI
jgi:hypothetical protein